MELKFESAIVIRFDERSNRTFMELKCTKSERKDSSRLF